MLIFIIVLGILILVHEFGHFITAKRNGVRVETFSLGFGPKIVSIKKNDTEYRLSAIPLGGYIKMAGESHADNPSGEKWEFLSKSVWQRFKIVISGPLLNYILAFFIFSIVFMMGIPMPENTNRIGSLLKNYPALESGIQKGDAIIAIDGEKTKDWEGLVRILHKKTEGNVALTIQRDGKKFDINLKPNVEKRFISGKGEKIALIGIRPAYTIKKYSIFESIKMGIQKLITLSILTLKAIGYMITGRLSPRQVTGPIGIFVMTGEMAKLGFIYLLDFVGLISASLAIFNILPIPVLDGGHIVFLAIEKIRRKPLSFKAQENAVQVGMYLLIALMLFVIVSDISKFEILERITGLFKK